VNTSSILRASCQSRESGPIATYAAMRAVRNRASSASVFFILLRFGYLGIEACDDAVDLLRGDRLRLG
jgi:hypothetical protein